MIDETVHSPKKLIEVTLPLDAINAACVREKSIRHGHPSTMHLWWARRPLAAARAVIFASMVNDPGYVNKEFRHGVNKEEAEKKRAELCRIIEDLVKWENTNNPEVLKRAHDAMMESWREICKYNKNHPRAKELFNPEKLPAFHDPFAGGGALPLEAQRLGLESFASDLNPVPVLINKGMIEIPPKFRGKAPSGPLPAGETEPIGVLWEGNQGLAEDIRRYGLWMREKAKEKIGKYYPDVEITEAMAEERPDLKPLVGQKFPVIAWIWARTVKSPNPLYADKDVPLASTFVLSKSKGSEAYIEPVVQGGDYAFKVKTGPCPKELEKGTSAGKMSAFTCLLSGSAIPYDYIREQAKEKGFGSSLLAIVVDSGRGRLYLSPDTVSSQLAQDAKPEWEPRGNLPEKALSFRVQAYGLEKWGSLYTSRQKLALTTFSDLISNELDDQAETVVKKAEKDAVKAGFADDHIPLCRGG